MIAKSWDGWGRLISPSEAERLARLAGSIPDLGDVVGFECRLGSDDATVDFGLRISRGDVLSQLPQAVSPDDTSAWRGLRAFSAEWAEAGSDLERWIIAIFLEFDATDTSSARSVPSVFLTLDEPLRARTSDARGVHVVRHALALLNERPLEADVAARLTTCFERLPLEGHMLHVGAMLGRAESAVRISVAVPRHQLESYLSAIEAPATSGVIAAALQRLAVSQPNVHLELDVESTIGSRWGIVIAVDESDWPHVVARLTTNGLCDGAKGRSLLAWPGTTGRSGSAAVLHRSISHLKLVYAPDTQPVAKAYLVSAFSAP